MELRAFKEHPFVRALQDEQVAKLLPCAREVSFPERTFVFREGGAADTLYLLRSGCVVLEQHIPGRGALQVESLCGGDILGLSLLFPSARWTLDARCAEPVQAFALDAGCVTARMREDSALGFALATHLVEALYHRLYVACEGRVLIFLPECDCDRAVETLRALPLGAGAARIGRVGQGPPGMVALKTRMGAHRLLDLLSGEQLPRIC